jgi:hypothetical protein
VTLYGNVIWFPDQFLLSCLPDYGSTVDKYILISVTAGRQAHLQDRAASVAQDAKTNHSQVGTMVS